MSRSLSAWPFLVFILVAAAVAFALHREHRLLASPHEYRAIETAREMRASHEWIVPQLRGLPRLEKPPLAYWASMIAFGSHDEPSVGAARVAAAIAGLVTLLAIWFLARDLADRAVANVAAAVAGAGLVAIIEFRKVTSDPFLTAGCAVAIAAWAAALRRDRLIGQALWLVGFGGLGLALLAKGPIALVFAGIGLGFVRPSAPVRKPGLATLLIGLVIAFGPIAWWAHAVFDRLPDALSVWKREIGSRLEHDAEDGRSVWTYAGTLLKFLAPWTLAFIASLVTPGDQRTRRARWWFLTGLAFLLCLSSRKDAYALPLLPPAAIVTAGFLVDCARGTTKFGRIVLVVQCALIALGVPALIALSITREMDLSGAAAVLGAASAIGTVMIWLQRGRPTRLLTSTLATALLAMCLYQGVLETFAPQKSGRYHLGNWIARNVPGSARFVSIAEDDAVIMFYGRRVPELFPDAPAALAARRGETFTLARTAAAVGVDLGVEVARIVDPGETNPVAVYRWTPRAESR